MLRRIIIATSLVMAMIANSAAYSQTIVNDKITVPANQCAYYGFSVSKVSEIRGRFRAEGGSGNDIECYILDADAFENWRNGHTANTWYNSGRVTVANIYVKVPAGTYYLVFNNRFAWVSNKVVAAVAEIH